MNTRCQALLSTERAVRRLGGARTSGLHSSTLVDLFRSDFRTRATEEKIREFESTMGQASATSRKGLAGCVPALADGEEVLIVNPGSKNWEHMPIEVPLRFPPGRHMGLEVVVRRGEPLPPSQIQIEVLGRHRDGSIREATLVLEPTLGARSVLGLGLLSSAPDAPESGLAHEVHSVGTASVQADFLSHRGGALESVCFPGLSASALFGTISHGHFDAMAFSPDFYSGHVVALNEHHEKKTDLTPVRLGIDKARSGPVRITLESQFDSSFGPWRKRYRLYRNSARIDIGHDLSFHEARLASLRFGAVTLRPEAWDRDSLRYGTVNGGAGVEWRGFGRGVSLAQSSAVSPSVTATSCLGATEGWVALADRERGLLISGDRSRAAVAPLLDFEEVDDSFFCRLSHTAAESDETRASFLRGRLGFDFSIEGFVANDPQIFERARQRLGLLRLLRYGCGQSRFPRPRRVKPRVDFA